MNVDVNNKGLNSMRPIAAMIAALARVREHRSKIVAGCTTVSLALALVAHANAAETDADRKALIRRLEMLEKRLNELQQQRSAPAKQTSGARTTPPVKEAQSQPAVSADTQAIIDRLSALEERLGDLESKTVLSEPKTVVKQVQVYVDANGNEYDHPVDGAKPTITYQRETAHRRQTIKEEIEDALASEKASGINLGVSNVTTAQVAFQTKGESTPADRHVYGLSAADVTFQAQSAALNTTFFADVVGIGGSPPDKEIAAVNLLNSQTARLSNNQLSLREAWIKTALFDQKLSLSVGRLDLTSYFDHNAVANDESTQFISDALVNNPVLGLTTNGLGLAAVYDPKIGVNFKFGVQQSKEDATSLSKSLYTLGEIEYLARPFSLPEGHYRLWGRQDNSTGEKKSGFGVSFDQKLAPAVTLFGRYGNGFVGSVDAKMRFYSGGLGFQAPLAFNPLDTWGIGYAKTEIVDGANEKVMEAFYNLNLTHSLSLSFLLQYVMEPQIGADYVLPGLRLKVAF
jgi:hypothetical protein